MISSFSHIIHFFQSSSLSTISLPPGWVYLRNDEENEEMNEKMRKRMNE